MASFWKKIFIALHFITAGLFVLGILYNTNVLNFSDDSYIDQKTCLLDDYKIIESTKCLNNLENCYIIRLYIYQYYSVNDIEIEDATREGPFITYDDANKFLNESQWSNAEFDCWTTYDSDELLIYKPQLNLNEVPYTACYVIASVFSFFIIFIHLINCDMNKHIKKYYPSNKVYPLDHKIQVNIVQ